MLLVHCLLTTIRQIPWYTDATGILSSVFSLQDYTKCQVVSLTWLYKQSLGKWISLERYKHSMAKSDSCLRKIKASQHCSAYFTRNALLEFRINIPSLGMLVDYLAGGGEGKISLLPSFHSSSLCLCSVCSCSQGQKRGKAACLFSWWTRQILQPTLNVVVEVRVLHLWAFQEKKNLPLQYRVVLTLKPQSTCHWRRKPAPIVELTFSKTHFQLHGIFGKASLGTHYFREEKFISR